MTETKLHDRAVFENRDVRYGVMGSGPPAVVVHGTPWSSHNMRHIIADLASRYTVYFFDLLGYGSSAKSPGEVSLATQGRLLAELMRVWGLHAPLVVAHDIGGAAALRAALLEGARYSRLVLIDPVAIRPWGSSFLRHVREHEAAFAGAPAYIHRALLRAYIESAVHVPLPEHVLARIIEPHLGSLDTPVLILWGTEDAWIPAAQGPRLRQFLPHARLEEIPDAGHLVIEERRLSDAFTL